MQRAEPLYIAARSGMDRLIDGRSYKNRQQEEQFKKQFWIRQFHVVSM
jgi:hypothetical protein